MSEKTGKVEENKSLQIKLNNLVTQFKENLDKIMEQWMPITAPKTRGKPVEYPLTDLIDNGDHYIIEAELPGVRKKNIIVEIAADIVRIKGSINLDRENKYGLDKYLLRERRDQDFNKEILLPQVVNPKEAKAMLEEGVLRIIVPKKSPESLEWTRIVINEGL